MACKNKDCECNDKYKSKSIQVEIQETSDGELFFQIPPALLEDLGWEEGDEVKFIDNKNGTFKIKKVKYETIELDFDDQELLKYMQFAHEKNITFNCSIT